jgi:hypothetical protein
VAGFFLKKKVLNMTRSPTHRSGLSCPQNEISRVMQWWFCLKPLQFIWIAISEHFVYYIATSSGVRLHRGGPGGSSPSYLLAMFGWRC